MRLAEHEDFAAFVTAAASEAGLPELFVEKDYWITEILRAISETLGDRAIFKGGTSLSKGWDLLDRFSEDIDLFIDPSIQPQLVNARAINRTLKRLNQDVAAIPGLDFLRDESRTIGGRGRIDTFGYQSRFPQLQGFPPTVRLEPGIQSGDHPTSIVKLSSIVARMLNRRGVVEELGVEGLDPFPMTLLHFRRTFVEKLFAIHGKVERLREDGTSLGRDSRHYADLYVLSAQPEVTEMLEFAEYQEIKADYDEKSRAYFPKQLPAPTGLELRR